MDSSHESYGGTPCILWTGHVDREGYPNKVQVAGVVTSAHRMAYWIAFGPIPAGLQIDHRCHDPAACTNDSRCPHRRCVNPLHLEAVTPRENTLRSGGVAAADSRATTCARGHVWDEVHASGRRRCSRCEQELARSEYERRTETNRGQRNGRRRQLDADEGRQRRKNRAAWLAKRGLRPEECLNGHRYVGDSFRIGASGKRICLRCRSGRNASQQQERSRAPGAPAT